ncbi:enoyl-CoA hydratase/isomerase family protein [Streptomyces sp. NPDC088124]|uniref:enoyl-CoA hydratase/isomerase family protein n=1 Tax=Streptomyces sp. NPDC088124 TaxID=3154654 RepID=UPI00343B11F1
MPAADPATDLVLVEHQGPVAVVTINRPAKYNAISPAVVTALDAALGALGADPRVRAIILTGAGKAFAAGADISFYAQADREEFTAFTGRCNALCDRIATSPVPVVAAVRGLALGGGFELVLSCDVVVAEQGAAFGLPEVSLGLLPGWGGTQRLTWHVGPNRAKWLIMSGERLDATTAEALGIVTHICDTDALLPVALRVADALAAQSPRRPSPRFERP